MYTAADRCAGGIHAEDRNGQPAFFPPVSMAAGVVRVGAEAVSGMQRVGSQQIGAAAAAAKHAAKRAANGLAVLDFMTLAGRLPG